MYTRAFRKYVVVPLYMEIYLNNDIVDIKGRALFKMEGLTNVTIAKMEESTKLPSMLLILL